MTPLSLVPKGNQLGGVFACPHNSCSGSPLMDALVSEYNTSQGRVVNGETKGGERHEQGATDAVHSSASRHEPRGNRCDDVYVKRFFAGLRSGAGTDGRETT